MIQAVRTFCNVKGIMSQRVSYKAPLSFSSISRSSALTWWITFHVIIRQRETQLCATFKATSSECRTKNSHHSVVIVPTVTFNNTFALLRVAALNREMDFPVLMSKYFNVSSKWQLPLWHRQKPSLSQTLKQEVCLRDNVSILPP